MAGSVGQVTGKMSGLGFYIVAVGLRLLHWRGWGASSKEKKKETERRERRGSVLQG
jgi:hypothetical protein